MIERLNGSTGTNLWHSVSQQSPMNTREKNVILQFYIALTVSEAGAVN